MVANNKVVKPNLNLQQNIVSVQRGEQYTTGRTAKTKQGECTQKMREPMNPQKQKKQKYK